LRRRVYCFGGCPPAQRDSGTFLLPSLFLRTGLPVRPAPFFALQRKAASFRVIYGAASSKQASDVSSFSVNRSTRGRKKACHLNLVAADILYYTSRSHEAPLVRQDLLVCRYFRLAAI